MILQPYLNKFVVVYFNNILVFLNLDKEHEEHLCLILEKLKENNLYAKPLKYVIRTETIKFYSYIIS
jgi:hypothetical protein